MPDPAQGPFPRRLRELAADRGLSLRALAARPGLYMSKSKLHRIATGVEMPTRAEAELIDQALDAGGELVAHLDTAAAARLARVESQEITGLVCAGQLDDAADVAGQGALRLAVDYLSHPAADMLVQATDLRRVATTALARFTRPDDSPDAIELILAIGRLSGVLAYAALDLDDPATAAVHCEAAWACAHAIGHNGLRAWVRGTQSLVSRFAGDFDAALDHACDGLRYARSGPARARLLCGIAQSHANMGDGRAARRALQRARDTYTTNGAGGPGLLGFAPAKLAYYSGSALIWLDGRADAELAVAESRSAVSLWASGPAEERSFDDEALAHVYAATALLKLHDLEQAVDALEPVLGLPEERRISWMRKRLARIGDLLAGPPYASEPIAAETRDRIHSY